MLPTLFAGCEASALLCHRLWHYETLEGTASVTGLAEQGLSLLMGNELRCMATVSGVYDGYRELPMIMGHPALTSGAPCSTGFCFTHFSQGSSLFLSPLLFPWATQCCIFLQLSQFLQIPLLLSTRQKQKTKKNQLAFSLFLCLYMVQL